MTTEMIQEPVMFRCPCCEATLSIPVEQAGVTGPCPHCHQMVRSPLRATEEDGSKEIMESGFSLKKLLPFEKRLRWDADGKEWRCDRRLRFTQRDFWEGAAAKIDCRKTGWAIAAVFVIFMGTVAYRDGYQASSGPRGAAKERMADFSLPEGRTGEMGMEPAAQWVPPGGYFSAKQAIPEP